MYARLKGSRLFCDIRFATCRNHFAKRPDLPHKTGMASTPARSWLIPLCYSPRDLSPPFGCDAAMVVIVESSLCEANLFQPPQHKTADHAKALIVSGIAA
jgi:hypothetical protein